MAGNQPTKSGKKTPTHNTNMLANNKETQREIGTIGLGNIVCEEAATKDDPKHHADLAKNERRDFVGGVTVEVIADFLRLDEEADAVDGFRFKLFV